MTDTPRPAVPARQMTRAIERATRTAMNLTQNAPVTGPGGGRQAFADAGRASVRRAITACRRGGQLPDPGEIAWLGLALTDLRVRDYAWAQAHPYYSHADQRLWAGLLRHQPPELTPAPAALLALAAWHAGDTATAAAAIQQALDADPGYTMALLLAGALHAPPPPAAFRLPPSARRRPRP